MKDGNPKVHVCKPNIFLVVLKKSSSLHYFLQRWKMNLILGVQISKHAYSLITWSNDFFFNILRLNLPDNSNMMPKLYVSIPVISFIRWFVTKLK